MTQQEQDTNKGPAPSVQHDVQQAISDQMNALSGALEGGLSAASDALRSGTAAASHEAAQAASTAKAWYASTAGYLKTADETVIGTLKHGVELALEHDAAAAAAAAAVLAVLLPGPRRLLWRQTLGRFRSTEASQRSAELRAAALAERVDAQGGEVQKLAERMALAREEHARGLAKLRSTASELRSLSGRVQSTERSARGLMADLRELQSKTALQMRSDVAVKAAAAAGQRAALEKLVMGLAKEGI